MMERHVATAFVSSLCAAVLRQRAPASSRPTEEDNSKTVRSAIDSIPDENAEPRLIVIKPGTYQEQVVIKSSKPFLTLRGPAKEARKTIVPFNRESDTVGRAYLPKNVRSASATTLKERRGGPKLSIPPTLS